MSLSLYNTAVGREKNGTHNFIFIIFYVFLVFFLCMCIPLPNKSKSIDFLCRLLYIFYLKLRTHASTHTRRIFGNNTTNVELKSFFIPLFYAIFLQKNNNNNIMKKIKNEFNIYGIWGGIGH